MAFIRFCGFMLLFGCVSFCSVFAKAPTTAKIAFTSTRDGNREIYLMNPDGSQQIRLTHNPANDLSPAWAPTGERILFVSDRDGPRDLYLMDPDGTNVTRLFGKAADRQHPAWAPNGKQIAYTLRKPGEKFISIATIGRQKEERLAIGTGATWSPDGRELAFLTGAPERRRLSRLNVQTRKQKVVFPRKAIPSLIGSVPAWAPTDNGIAFSWLHRVPLRAFGETETIYVVRTDGTGIEQLVAEAGPRVRTPVWSPRGDAILYDQEDTSARLQIFKKVLASGEVKQLTHNGIFYQANTLPAWFDPAFALPVSPQPQVLTTIWGKLKAK